MKSGARGLAAGRNVFMAADPAAKVREVRQILDAGQQGEQQPTLAVAWMEHDGSQASVAAHGVAE
jgi:hypothetical protein